MALGWPLTSRGASRCAPSDGAVAVVEFDTFDTARGDCDPTANAGAGALACTRRNLGRISRVGCSWRADTTTTGRAPGLAECCCATVTSVRMGCALICLPPGVRPPSAPPVPPRTPPGVFNANYTAAFAPILPVRDYSLMSVDNETMLFVGGYVQIGTQAVSWGDPTHLALVTATRLPPLGYVPSGTSSGTGNGSAPSRYAAPPPPMAPGPLLYGNCTPGCGRATGIDECAPCTLGTYGTGDGICRQCPIGKSGATPRASTAAVACASCAPGSYSPVHGATACRPCPPGAFCADGWSLDPITRLLRQVAMTGAIPLPVECPAGTYSPDHGNDGPEDCIACPAGTVAPQSGGRSYAAACMPCPAGMSNGNPGMARCHNCTPTQAQPRTGQPFCDICAPGTFSNGFGRTACTECPVGSFNRFSGGGHPNCTACPPGTYGNTRGRSSCIPCPNGTASARRGATSVDTCAPCTRGTYNSAFGASACMQCPTSAMPGYRAAVKALDDAAAAVCEASGLFASEAPPRTGSVAWRLASALGLVITTLCLCQVGA